MKQTLKWQDVMGLGMMTFAFFLGAGNIIFPPLAGQLAGDHALYTTLGFLATAVGLPLISIIAVARAGGGLPNMTRDLPAGFGTFASVLLFIVIGPAFAAPRTGLVAYEMALKPYFAAPDATVQMLVTAGFFAIAMALSWSRGALIDSIGKVMTPVLFLLLVVLAVAVVVAPQGVVEAAQGDYIATPFTKGFLDGYNTMDTFAALMFGMLIVDVIRSKGITDTKQTCNYLIIAGLIAAAGLAFVYVSLFRLGATSGAIAGGLDNGGAIFAAYVQALFGQPGQWILSAVVILACMTTAVGLISACSDYFSSLTALSYRQWVLILGVICAVVANVGLSTLISLSVPVLYALYPLAIGLVMLTFVRPWLRNPALSYRLVLGVALVFSLMDAAVAAGVNLSVMSFLPLFSKSMAWVLPTAIALVVALMLPAREQASQVQTA
ncbi:MULTISPECIES: branched-chain amino acid transport system II carrier protein [Plesiomonas]|uniref:Branched-chain amino acid transport system carrier protein n=2 Tax=Plesiomonas shigelloides TaxID=703 RepID=R8AMP5_PLESH|nr:MULTISPECIES: branched-chain amino acid transport system II carrier protein [Plesiomonas]MCE5162667.1 branched-chain amino acid transport system II carrier protein [Plesiomonas sp. PI-19]MDO4687809.1 branched-chain amino acid transport system II carrier protein [Plesiomonas sp.]AVQ88127.1 branched-chain amino acid transport system II carrier protein [Plesiomonas shigelloides]EON87609.1 branched-chain amino acid transport system II carrier protein [Plesiomonas shigelloides 302-73]KAB7655384.